MIFVFKDEDLSGANDDPQNVQQQMQQANKHDQFQKTQFQDGEKSNNSDRQLYERINENNGYGNQQDGSNSRYNRKQWEDYQGRLNANAEINGQKHNKEPIFDQFDSLPILHELSNSDFQDQSSIFRNDKQKGNKLNGQIQQHQQSQSKQVNRQLFDSAQKQQNTYNMNSQNFLSTLNEAPQSIKQKIGQQNPAKIGFTQYSQKQMNEKYKNINSNIQNTAINMKSNNQQMRRNIVQNNQGYNKYIDNRNQGFTMPNKSIFSRVNNEHRQEIQQQQLEQRIHQKKVQTLSEKRKQGFKMTNAYQSKLIENNGGKQRNGFLFEKNEKLYQQILLKYFKLDLEVKANKANGIDFIMFQIPNCIKPKPNREGKKVTEDKMYYGVLQSMKDKHFMEMLDKLQKTNMFSIDQIHKFQEKKLELLNNSFKYNFTLKPKKKKIGQTCFQNFGQKQNMNEISQSQNNNSANGQMSFNDFASESSSVNGIGWDNTNMSSDQFILNMMNSIKIQQTGNNMNKNNQGNFNDIQNNNQNFINNLYMNMNNADDQVNYSMNNEFNNDLNKNNNQLKINNNINKNMNKNYIPINNFNSKNNNYKHTNLILEQELEQSQPTNFFTQQNFMKRGINKQQNTNDIFKDAGLNQMEEMQNQEEIKGYTYSQKTDKAQQQNFYDQNHNEIITQQFNQNNTQFDSEQKGSSFKSYITEGIGRIGQFLKFKVFGQKQNSSQQ